MTLDGMCLARVARSAPKQNFGRAYKMVKVIDSLA